MISQKLIDFKMLFWKEEEGKAIFHSCVFNVINMGPLSMLFFAYGIVEFEFKLNIFCVKGFQKVQRREVEKRKKIERKETKRWRYIL